ncbi:META domain-containing protein [Neiella marina]|uniref:META domain-containing protein n=1 Tax=Neiella holothuriorum TaxID=2870530 RepID=A0ABS7EKY8_9GAMM|nr:META domain-containing protein [Neiella holothuriorum]MBW8192352.1 META domain-containing protein [Neiella holothuriorum]
MLKVWLVTIMAVLAGCSSTTQLQGKVPTEEELVHHHYNLEWVDGKPLSELVEMELTPGKRPDIEFQEGFRLAGIAGCNRFMGQGSIKQAALYMAPGPSTRMACLGELSQVEQTVFQVLNDGAQIRIKGNQLILMHQDHKLIYELADYVQ